MNKLPFLSLLVALALFSSGCGGSSAKTPKDLAEIVLMSLKENEIDLYKKYVLDYSEFQAFMREGLSELEGKEKEELKEGLDSGQIMARFDKTRAENLYSWFEVREEGEDKGVEWEDVEFEDAECEIEERIGYEGTGGIFVTFKSGGQSFKLEIDGALKVDGTWKSAAELRWRR